MAEKNEWVTVRQLSGQLSDEKAHSGRLESSEGQRLRVSVPEIKAGALVEVQSERVLYFGVVLGKQDSATLIEIEHTVDRMDLAAIQEVWHGSPGE